MFADRVKYLRQSRELNQVQFAQKMGVTKQSVSNWENDNIMPSVDMLERIADYFKVSTDYLLGLTDEPEPPMHISKEEKALVETYRSLSREQRELISQTIRLMGEQNNRREG